MSIENDPGAPVLMRERNHWQDWANLVLGVWLFISPWVLSFAAYATGIDGSTPAAMRASWDSWIIGVCIAILAAAAINRLRIWEEVLNMVLGIWLFIAPWVLGFPTLSEAAWDHWIVGVLVFVLAIWDVQAIPRVAGRLHYR